MTIRYLTTSEVADRLGVGAGTIRAYVAQGRLPEPDAVLGTAKGWLPATIDTWHAARPGHGGRPRTTEPANT